MCLNTNFLLAKNTINQSQFFKLKYNSLLRLELRILLHFLEERNACKYLQKD